MIPLSLLQMQIGDAGKQIFFFTFKVIGRKNIIIPEHSFWKKPENLNISVPESAWGPLPITYQNLVGSPSSKKSKYKLFLCNAVIKFIILFMNAFLEWCFAQTYYSFILLNLYPIRCPETPTNLLLSTPHNSEPLVGYIV